jgi:hypothetical protein
MPVPDQVRDDGSSIQNILKSLDSGIPDCVAIGRMTPYSLFVIPGLTRNPLLFQSITIMDAGSNPA